MLRRHVPNIAATGSAAAPPPPDPNVTAWVAVVVGKGGSVSAGRQTLLSALVTAMKSAGSWALTDWLVGLTAENTQSALTPLKGGDAMSTLNSPVFTVDRGYAFNGTNQLLVTGHVPSTMAVQMNGSNVRLGVYERTNVFSNTAAVGVGAATSITLRPRLTAGNMSAACLCQFAQSVVTADSRGYLAASKIANSVNLKIYKNGVAQTDAVSALVDTTLPAFSFYIGARNNNGTADLHRASTIGLVDIGAPFTNAAMEAAHYDAIQAYMAAIGAQV